MRKILPILIFITFLTSCATSRIPREECLKRGCDWVCEKRKGFWEVELYELTTLGVACRIVKDAVKAVTPRCRCVCPGEKEEAKEKKKQEKPEYTAP